MLKTLFLRNRQLSLLYQRMEFKLQLLASMCFFLEIWRDNVNWSRHSGKIVLWLYEMELEMN